MKKPLARGVCTVLFAIAALAYVCDSVDYQGKPLSGGAKLRTLAYVEVVDVPPSERQFAGVTSLATDKVATGINIYTPFMGNTADLLDMHGNRVHVLVDRRRQCTGGWEFVKPYVGGRFLVLAEGSCSPLFMIDWDSNVIWEQSINFHHDASFDADGNIYALSRELIHAPDISSQEPILDDQVVVLSSDGQVIKELSLAAMFSQDAALLDIIRREDHREYQGLRGDGGPLAWDVFHANTLEVLSIKESNLDSPFRSGNVLFCSRHLDLIGVIDVEAERVVWHWGPGRLDNPHGPTLLDNGHILVLDNGTRRGRSRIVEFDPRSGQITETIGDNERTTFFTALSGGVQRLPNGNTLIVESQRGRVFEVATDGTIVWEFYSFPFGNQTMRPSLYRMPRIVDYQQFPELQSNLAAN